MFTSFRSIIVKGVGRSLWLQPYRHQSPFNPCFKNVAFFSRAYKQVLMKSGAKMQKIFVFLAWIKKNL